ncbi:MAG: DUF2156 domain-containing protein [Desulfamplus sp.]|nr:DUF2156 domain-containing protein [Desulfamplus sp.]
MFQRLPDGISEFTFANLYLFQKPHNYKISRVNPNSVARLNPNSIKYGSLSKDSFSQDDLKISKDIFSQDDLEILVITGEDRSKNGDTLKFNKEKFFMLPFGIPQKQILDQLFDEHLTLKCASENQADFFLNLGYDVVEDRDNFDYIYKREHLAELPGRNYHKKRNLIKAFVNNHNYEGRPLLEEYLPDALKVLEKWREYRVENGNEDGDYSAAKEALEKGEQLQLCGAIYYVEDTPVAYSLGEELACGKSFVIHFEKAVNGYKGLWQFVNQAFASIITEHYETINREQDLGDEGLRHAKLSYHPTSFVKKYKVKPKTVLDRQ